MSSRTAGHPPAHVAPLAASLPSAALPRSGALTDLLVGAGAAGDEPVDDGAAAALRADLERRLAAAAQRGMDGPCVRIGTYDVATSIDTRRSDAGRAPGARHTTSGPFRWTAHRARRTVGLAALRAVLDGRASCPADAAHLVIAAPETHIAGAAAAPGSCAEWLTTMPAPARAMVEGAAATWATQLWTALDWARLGPGVRVGAPDRWWSGTASRCVAVRGRADVRLDAAPCSPGAGSAHRAHLLVLPGHPTPGNRCALALSGLVDLCTRGPGALPRRVVGWWPECGKAWAVPVTGSSLAATADAVVDAAEELLAPGGAHR